MYDEKEARINALQQLLTNSQADVVRAFEGSMPQAEYETLKTTRQAWKKELAELLGEAVKPECHNAPDVLQAAVEGQEQLLLTQLALVDVYEMILGEIGRAHV